jgi:F0F1-type ATP synthase membrane subunit c/vacuolar-type H+-ATPase subunit K
MLVLKAAKATALAHALSPLGGCAIGLGLVFAAFIRGVAYAPDLEDTLFSHAMLGFALIESFLIIAVCVMGVVYSL